MRDSGERPVYGSNRLVLAHFWAAFASFRARRFRSGPGRCWCAAHCIAGSIRSSTTAPSRRTAPRSPTYSPRSIAMGFGYAVCAVSLGRPMHGMRLAWAAFWLVIAGAVIALATVAAGDATVLYTFYPPLTGSPWYYIGILIAVVGSWIWIGLMVSHFARWKRDHPGLPVPLAMFATVAGALLWAWTSLGAGVGDRVPDPAQRLRLDVHDRCRARPHAVLVDAARHRVLLADPCLHRVLRAAAAGRRGTAVQRQDGPHRLPAAAGVLDADRLPPSVRGSRRSAPASSSSTRCSPPWWRCPRCSRSSRFAPRSRSPAACAAAVASSGGLRRCRGTVRSCSLRRSRW